MKKTEIAVITAGSERIGLGHVRRCLTLAQEFANRDMLSTFFLLEGNAVVESIIHEAGFSLERLSIPDLCSSNTLDKLARFGLLLLDSYEIDSRSTNLWPQASEKLLVLDDLANRPFTARWLSNSCMLPSESAYSSLTKAELFLGPSFALLRNEFQHASKPAINAEARKLLVSIGAADPKRISIRVLRALKGISRHLELRVVIGPLAEKLMPSDTTDISHSISFFNNPKSMAELIKWADAAIVGASQTLFELAALGCPAVGIKYIDNQIYSSKLFASIGSALILDDAAIELELPAKILGLLEDFAKREQMSRQGQAAVDALGAKRLAEKIITSLH